MKSIVQIVPQLPGTFDGVGDYALTLARALRDQHNIQTRFAVAAATDKREIDGFPVIPDAITQQLAGPIDHVLLHYANYGYQNRGVPLALRRWSKHLRKLISGRWLTMFHEIYASGPPWKSAFWLRPLQVSVARDLIEIADCCFASNTTVAAEIHRHSPGKTVRIVPVMSNFGEPQLTNFAGRAPQHWAICGGTALITRSLQALLGKYKRIPEWCAPRIIDAIGGRSDAAIQDAIWQWESMNPAVAVQHHPGVSANDASAILQRAAFGWLDYFGSGKIWPGMILKSGSFAALCAHGVIPVCRHREEAIVVNGDRLPIFGLDQLPNREAAGETAMRIHEWYSRNASSRHTAQVYAEALA